MKAKRKSPVKVEKPKTALEQAAALLRPSHASSFQVERFVLHMNGITPYGKLKQVLREIEGRTRAIEASTNGKEASLSPSQIVSIIHENQALAALGQRYLDQVGGVEALQDADYVLALELDYHAQRLYRDAILDRATHGCISRGTLETICALPEGVAHTILDAVSAQLPALSAPDGLTRGLRAALETQVLPSPLPPL